MNKIGMVYLVTIAVLVAACGGGGGVDPAVSEAATATAAALAALPELGAEVVGAAEMTVRSRAATLVCTGGRGVVPNSFQISADNLTIYIPIGAEPGTYPIVGRNEAAALQADTVAMEYQPTSALFFASGGSGELTLESLPGRVGEYAMGSFSVELANTGGETVTIEGTFRADAILATFDECRDQLIETPVPPPTAIPTAEG
jgi:hypothetical protein